MQSRIREAALLLVVALTAAAGCAGVRESGESGFEKVEEKPSEKVEMAPTVVSIGDEEGEEEVFQTKKVFESAYDAFQNENYSEAVAKYAKIVEHAKSSEYYRPALYNLGLAAERHEDWKRAAASYRRLVDEFPGHDQSTDAYFRLAGVHRQMEQYEKGVRLLEKVRERDGLKPYDRVDAHVRRGELLLKLERFDNAEQALRTGRNLNAKFSEETSLGRGTAMDARSSLGLGRVLHAEMRQIRLELPVEHMTKQIEWKMGQAKRAHASYLHAVRVHHPRWSVAAGFEAGKLFEDFVRDVYRAERPDDFTEEQLEYYFTELHDRMQPILKRSANVYERTLEFAERLDGGDESKELVERTERRLERVRRILDEPERLAERARK